MMRTNIFPGKDSRRCQQRKRGSKRRSVAAKIRDFAALLALAAVAAISTACGSVSGGGGNSGGPGPQTILVRVSPTTATAILGTNMIFQANVTGTTNTAVTWSVNGVAGGSTQTGTISANGSYSAPAMLPANSGVTITATSSADASISASASVTITSDIVVLITPPAAGVPLGATQSFTASLTSAGKPSPDVTWSLNATSGGDATMGTIAANGADAVTYTAPGTLPSPPTVSITATSVADPSKSTTASIGIGCASANGISPGSATLSLAQSQNFSATLCGTEGAAVVWDVNGVAGGSAALGTVTNTGAATTTYTAPADRPATNSVSIHAAANGVSAAALVTVVSNVTISITPGSGNVVVQRRASFTATVSNSPDQSVVWTVNGIANGNAQAGEICVANSNPCVPPVGAGTETIDYLAPNVVPGQNPVLLAATSVADPSQSAAAQIKIVGASGEPSSVTISPLNAFLLPSGSTPSQLQFAANVTGTSNTSVTWSVASGVAGSGCGGAACGTIDANGVYTAPTSAPTPNAISVTATSIADLSQSASAAVAITSGPAIEQILPSSVMAGVATDFSLGVNGVGFVAGRGVEASVILVNGNPRDTICNSVARCSATLRAQDVGNPGVLTVQVQNPGAPVMLSNPVLLVIVPFTLSRAVISLSGSQPESDSNDIVVFEPTSAASGPSQVSVDFAGPISSGATCNFDSSPITLVRPASGVATTSICIHGNALDPGFFYQFSGPLTPDIFIAPSELAGLFPNTIELDLTISSATLPGVRSLFITTPNNDQAVATALVEVQ